MDSATYKKKLSDYFSTVYVHTALELANDVGILDILYSAKQPLTSIEIAEEGNLKERYVREMLGCLASAELIQVDSSSSKFHIPESHKGALRKQMIYGKIAGAMRPRMEAMKNIFTKDGPECMRFDDILFNALEERTKLSQDSFIENDILASLPQVKEQLEKGMHVAELGCAQGIVLLNLAARYPKSTFVGIDIVEKLLDEPRQLVAERGLKNLTFEVHDIQELPEVFNNSFDWIFIQDTLHDLPSPSKALKAVNRVLKKDGIASLFELGMKGSLADNVGSIYWAKLYAMSTFFCIPESFQQQGSEALGACWGVEKARELIDECGFTLVKEIYSDDCIGCVHYVCKRK